MNSVDVIIPELKKLQAPQKFLTIDDPFQFINNRKFDFKGQSKMWEKNKMHLFNDIDGIKKNEKWFEKQFHYQKSLPFIQQIMILCYTYGGDQIIHAYLSGPFIRKNVLKHSEYQTKYVFPLYPVFVEFMCHEPKDFLKFMMKYKPPDFDKERWIDELEEIGYSSSKQSTKCGSDIFSYYRQTYHTFFSPNAVFLLPVDFYKCLAQKYAYFMQKIIMLAPKLSCPLIVYRGVKTIDYLNFTNHNTHIEKRFVSTSLDIDIATETQFVNEKCCILKMFLLKNTKCLFPILSYFQEFEIILPPNSKFYARHKYQPSSGYSQMAINLVVI